MFNYSQKYFLILFSFCILPAYAMKRKELDIIPNKQIEANNELVKAVQDGLDNDFSQEKDWEKIKKCLKQADPNCKLDHFGTTVLRLGVSHEKKDFVDYLLKRGDVNINDSDDSGWSPLFLILERLNSADEDEESLEEIEPALQIAKNLLLHKADIDIWRRVWKETPLSFAARCGYNDLVKVLIKCGADINQVDKLGYNPLKEAIEKGHLDVIIELCKAGASLSNLNDGYNAFHLATGLPNEYIKVLITHSQSNFAIVDEKRDEQIRKIVKTILFVFKHLNFPKEIQFNIFSKLPPYYFYNAEKGLCKKLDDVGYKHPSVLARVNNHIGWVKKILKDANNKTKQNALEYLYNDKDCDNEYKQKIKSLLDGSEIDRHYCKFAEKFPRIDPNNLIGQMYINYSNQ